jgi:ribosomal protein S18 acetylase RimI-like enzyme
MDPTNPTILVRAAIETDIGQLCDLLALLFGQEADFTPDVERQARGLRLIIEQPQVGRIYCATTGETVVGMVSILFSVSTAEGGPAAWLEDMVVLPDYRGKGVGVQLVREAISGARASGCSRITLLTDPNNDSAARFYERAGFTRSQMTPLRLQL